MEDTNGCGCGQCGSSSTLLEQSPGPSRYSVHICEEGEAKRKERRERGFREAGRREGGGREERRQERGRRGGRWDTEDMNLWINLVKGTPLSLGSEMCKTIQKNYPVDVQASFLGAL